MSDSRAWPVDTMERRTVASLVPYARNPRKHSDAQVTTIASLIQKFGWTNPPLIDEADGILCGHGRILAAQQLGIVEVPVMIARGWSEAEKRAYIIADNQSGLSSEWDTDLLRGELEALKIEDFDLKFTAFDDGELNKLLGYSGETDPDEAPAVQERAVSRTGDLWLLGGESGHRLLCGDATKAEDVTRAMGEAKPHLMVTDPPYGVNYDPDWRNRADRANGRPYGARAVGTVTNDDRSDWTPAYAAFPGDVIYSWHPPGAKSVEFHGCITGAGFEVRMQIIWAKNVAPIGRGNYHVKHEPCWYAVRKGKTAHWNGDRSQTTLWQIDKPVKSETGHSTQKPVECMKRPIENNSRAGDAVYDPFIGSGTTIIAAEMTGRVGIFLEIAPQYCDVAVRRWEKFTGKQATLEGDGRTFDEIAAERADGRDSADPEKVVHPPRPAGSGLFE